MLILLQSCAKYLKFVDCMYIINYYKCIILCKQVHRHIMFTMVVFKHKFIKDENVLITIRASLLRFEIHQQNACIRSFQEKRKLNQHMIHYDCNITLCELKLIISISNNFQFEHRYNTRNTNILLHNVFCTQKEKYLYLFLLNKKN